MSGIIKALTEHAQDEGVWSALSVAEQWHSALESMAEAANDEERKAISVLLKSVNSCIENALISLK